MPFPSPGDLSNPGTEPMSLVSPALLAGSLPTELLGKPICIRVCVYIYNLNDQRSKGAFGLLVLETNRPLPKSALAFLSVAQRSYMGALEYH